MQEIRLNTGAIALVDDADFPMANRWKWKQHKDGYAYRTVRKGAGWTNVYLHRLLMEPKEGEEVDHINRNRLNCCRSNMRNVPHWENSHNRTATNQHNRGKKITRGVTKPKGRNRWLARIYVKNERIHLGTFATQEEAEKAYADAKREHGIN